jgi:hypothetical protein
MTLPDHNAVSPCHCGRNKSDPDGYCRTCRDNDYICPDDGIDLNSDGYCAICGMYFEEGEAVER